MNWISIKDQLPIPGLWVLIRNLNSDFKRPHIGWYIDEKEMNTGQYNMKFDPERHYFDYQTRNAGCYDDEELIEITHWIEIPEWLETKK